ncbi:hypothetical protein [Acidithiobacillus caldus]|uniref:hypothetical protein n=1 Tax=Acidithiobacillus caldus TaxID=33059 RepID=UPI001C078F1D|nr:hypothetical protein [Acidithiobacillus caldus]MBU2770116.1 hypothetical protein [Acidithiobacillus caldus]
MLDNRTILDKHSVADYALIYPGSTLPSPQVRDDIRYCIETEKANLYTDRNGDPFIFASEADAFEFRRIACIDNPVLAFYDRPLPDFDDAEGIDEDEGIDADFPGIEAPLDLP